jgi:hypothetical protein
MLHLGNTVGRTATNHPSDVRVIQQLLNRFRPLPLPLLRVDGNIDVHAVAAIEHFQRTVMKMTTPDGVVSPGGPTFRALMGGHDLERLAWGARVSGAFKTGVGSIAKTLALNPDFLMAAMAFETGETFSPSITNAAGSGAVGLIQFMPATAKALGTTTAALATMTAEAQLEYVGRYFLPKRGRLSTIEDTYMAILYPAAIGRPDGKTLFSRPATVYQQNMGLDTNRDGNITIREAAAAVRKKYDKGVRPGYIG